MPFARGSYRDTTVRVVIAVLGLVLHCVTYRIACATSTTHKHAKTSCNQQALHHLFAQVREELTQSLSLACVSSSR